MADTPTYPQGSVDAVRAALTKFGITNKYLQVGILSTVGKETGFHLRPEDSYSTTSNERIRSIFKGLVSGLSEDQLTALKKDDVKFFEKVYGGRFGNNNPGDGYKYRGRAFNGITFKGNYAKYGKEIGVDLVSNPDKLNDVKTAADAMAAYYVDSFATAKKNGTLKKQIGVDDISQIKDSKTATKAAVQATSGWSEDFQKSDFGKENLDKALSNVDYFMNLLSIQNVSKTIQKHWMAAIVISAVVAAAIIGIVKLATRKV